MGDENFHFDAPCFFDFTNGTEFDLHTDDWFSRKSDPADGTLGQTLSTGKKPHRVAKEPEADSGAGTEEDLSDTTSSSCSSPTKKQRLNFKGEHDPSAMPRRSPRLLATTQYKQTYGKSTGALPNKILKSTEEIELEEIARKRDELAKSRKMHEILYKKTKLQGKIARKAVQPPTLPKEFNFHSDQRIRGVAEGAEDTSVQDFAKTLRTALPNVETSKGNSKCRFVTKPKPFNLTTAKSASSLTNTDKYKSTAEQIDSFKTDYFRSSSRAKDEVNRKRPESPGLTVAKTPTLNTRGRTRSVKLLTKAEEEELEFEEHKKQQFKAHPVNHKILKEPQLGVPKVPPKAPTAVKEFNLHTTSSYPRLAKDQREEETNEFHAHAVNRKILEGPVGVKPAEKRPITVPESPAFALRGRLRSRERMKAQEEAPVPAPVAKVVSKPVLHAGVPFRPQLEHKFTVPKPFAVEDHSKEMLKKKEEKIKQVLEEERKAREFHATLLPSDSPDQLPAKKTRPVTAAEPFHLAVDERGKKYNEEWRAKASDLSPCFPKQIQAQEEEARLKTQFHASSNNVIFKAPFVPEKPTRPLTEMSSFTLNTDQRAVKREHFNQQLKAHEAEIEAIKRQREERKEREENEEVAKLRQEMVHKAAGVKKYKSVAVQPSDKPLTEAQSPFLRTNRLRARQASD